MEASFKGSEQVSSVGDFRPEIKEFTKMNCLQAKRELTTYHDGMPDSALSAELESHLAICPVCRGYQDEILSVSLALRKLSRPKLQKNTLDRLRGILHNLLSIEASGPQIKTLEPTGSWVKRWLIPSFLGAACSIMLASGLIWSLAFSAPNPELFLVRRPSSLGPTARDPVLAELAKAVPPAESVSPSEFVNLRHNVAVESPSINPRGTLVALANRFTADSEGEKEVTIVADVMDNGLAQVSDILEFPEGVISIAAFEKALNADPEIAPFVPANLDRRSQRTRVVLKMQNITVRTTTTQKMPSRQRL